MNRKSTLIFLNLFVFGLIVLSIAGLMKIYKTKSVTTAPAEKQSDPYVYLTSASLKKLPPLPDTERIVPTGKTREFMLEAKESEWEVLPGVKTNAVTYNGKTPGPVLRAVEGDLVRITVKNSLKQPTSIHFHGMHLPNGQDGVPPYTQKEVEPGGTFTYEFLAGHAGTYMYHPHINSVEQIDKGLYGAFVIDPQDSTDHLKYDKEYIMVLGGWNIPEGSYDRKALEGTGGGHNMNGMKETKETEGTENIDDTKAIDNMEDMDEMNGMTSGMSMAMDYNFWTINGKAFPATEKIKVQKGDRVRIRLINISNAAHPMHLHGTDFRIIAEDSHPLSEPKIINTINVDPGKTFDIDFIADNPGQWVFHCHELHHTENDGIEPGGLMTVVEFEGESKQPSGGNNSSNMNHSSM